MVDEEKFDEESEEIELIMPRDKETCKEDGEEAS